MLVCPAGHFSKNPDVCDVCDLPLHSGPRTAQGDGPAAPARCAADQAATTALPTQQDGPAGTDPSQAATTVIPVESVRSVHPASTVLPDAPPAAATTAVPDVHSAATDVLPVSGPAATPGPQAATEVFAAPPSPMEPAEPVTPAFQPPVPAARPQGQPTVPPTGATAVLGQGRTAHWHAVLTVDAAWYAVQDTPYQMPPGGGSTVVPLERARATLGRRSRSRGTSPDIDCSTDPGVSRQHATFELVHGRWYVEDLGSANGTYVAHAGAPLPEHPISVGRRVEVGPGDTVYVGAWTRISIEDDDAWGVS